jgi:hypothetical protein
MRLHRFIRCGIICDWQTDACSCKTVPSLRLLEYFRFLVFCVWIFSQTRNFDLVNVSFLFANRQRKQGRKQQLRIWRIVRLWLFLVFGIWIPC